MSLTGSVPSLFGTLTAWARNLQQSRQIRWELQQGLRDRIERQIDDRIEPLCEQFQRVIQRLQNRDRKSLASLGEDHVASSPGVKLTGIEQLQSRSQDIFENTLAENAFASLPLQVVGLGGTALFWSMLSGPIVSVYRQYFQASYHALTDTVAHVDGFPHPPASMLFTSLLLSVLPLLIYCMLVLTVYLRRSLVERVSALIQQRHHQAIEELKSSGALKLHFENQLLDQAQFLIRLDDQLKQPANPLNMGSVAN
jgi:hypothetical protein